MEHFRMIGQAAQIASETVRLVRSLTGLDEKMQTLRRKMEILISREADLSEEIEYAETRFGNKRKREVDTWMTHLQRLKGEVQNLESRVEERRLIWRVNLVNHANRLIKEVDELEKQGKFPRGLTQIEKDDFGHEIPTVEFVGNAFKEHFGEILSCLTANEVSSIGVYGMGGVGKTTLATNIHNHLLKVRTFDVCWVTVSQECTNEALQYKIAKCQNLDLSNEDDNAKRAAKMLHFLRRKKLVMILDDVWSSFDLKEVGIPVGLSGCKLILTTRSLNICRQMECQQLIKVEKLSEDEAWHLFMRNLGQHAVFPLDVEQIARSMAKECRGLPLGIVVVSGSMRGIKNIYEWRNALEELRNANFNQEFMEKVFGVLKFSYTRLSDPILQQCFLHIASFPEDLEFPRIYLVRFLVDARLIGGMSSRRAELDRAHSIVTKLENVCLIESTRISNNTTGEMDCLKMHDLVRNMVINMMGSRFMIKAGLSMTEVPKESEWTESLEIVSLMYNRSIVEIPTNLLPKCPKLSMLTMHFTSVAKIGDSFFHFMPSLQVLDLSSTPIEILPNSISKLENLTSLCLRGCVHLGSVPSLGKLKGLETLDLSYSGLRIAPEGMDSLVNLKFLDVTGSKLEKLPLETLPNMSQLQCLCLNSDDGHLTVKASELISLGKLETLKCTFSNSDEFNEYMRYLQHQGPSSWDIRLGEHPLGTTMEDYNKVVRLDSQVLLGGRPESLLLPKDIDVLIIRRSAGVDLRTLMDIPSLESMRNLQVYDICNSKSLEDVMHLSPSSRSLSQHYPSQAIRILELAELEKLRSFIQAKYDRGIIHGVLSYRNVFSHLKILEFYGCNRMKKLLAYVFLPILVNVEELVITRCDEIEELFPVTEGGNEAMKFGKAVTPMVSTLPKLKSLRLANLPSLGRICSRIIVCDHVQELSIQRCPMLRKIPLFLHVHQNGKPSDRTTLLGIEISKYEKDWWRSLEFTHPDDKTILQQYVHFV